MGYPNREVPMTSVHGEPQQGGRLPADIWHAYMSAVIEHQPCVPFPVAKEPLTFQPFFGKFATTGRPEAPEHKSKNKHGSHNGSSPRRPRAGDQGGTLKSAPRGPSGAPRAPTEKPRGAAGERLGPARKPSGPETQGAGKTGGAAA
jgi:membrane peptidoglycan carboxypeptidase